MDRNVGSQTRATLLARLRQLPADQAAWGEFTAWGDLQKVDDRRAQHQKP